MRHSPWRCVCPTCRAWRAAIPRPWEEIERERMYDADPWMQMTGRMLTKSIEEDFMTGRYG